MRLPCAKQLPGWKPPFLKTVKIWPLHQKKTLLLFSLQSVKDCFYLTSSLPLPYYLLPPFSSTWNSCLTWVGFERSCQHHPLFQGNFKMTFQNNGQQTTSILHIFLSFCTQRYASIRASSRCLYPSWENP